MEKKVYTFDYINSNPSSFFKGAKIGTQNFLIYNHETLGQCLLLMIRPDNDRAGFAGELCPFGGSHETIDGHTENSFEAGIRETKEESGINVENIVKFGTFYNPRGHMVNMLASFINNEQLKQLSPSKDEVAAVCLLPIEKLRGYFKDIKFETYNVPYREGVHNENLKNSGFSVITPMLYINKKDMEFLYGGASLDEIKFRPQGFIQLERLVLSQKEQPLHNISEQKLIEPCFNLEAIQKINYPAA